MADGFRVDLIALEQAADGINDTLAQVSRRNVSDLAKAASAVGHSRLGETVAEFCDRWQLGVENLAKDAQAIAGLLTDSMIAYQRIEQGVHDHLNSILQSPTGPDPAAK